MDERRDPMDVMISGLKPKTDALRELHATPGAEDLLDGILATSSTETRPVRFKRLVRTLALAAALGVAVAVVWVAASSVHPRQAAAAPISFVAKDGYIFARVTDPYASKAELDAAFAQHGFDITVTLVPASPSVVGMVPSIGGAQNHQIKTYYDPSCYTEGGGHCPTGILISEDFAGKAWIDIGRPAQPGERYSTYNNAFMPGEPLHCTNLPGMTVDQATPILNDLGIHPIWRSSDRSIDTVSGIDPSMIGSLLIQDEAAGVSPGVVGIWVGPNIPPPFSDPASHEPGVAFNEGC
jgi:hypothetical protein